MTCQFKPLANDPAEYAQLVQLFREVWPSASHLTPEYIHWQYKANPDGMAVGVNAWEGGRIVAHYAAIPKPLRINEATRKCLLSLNTAVLPSHQGKGLFVSLAKETYSAAKEAGFEGVIGVANANSVHGFTKRLGFLHLGQLDVRVSLGLPKVLSQNVSSFGTETILCPIRTHKYFDWRLGNPSRRYFSVTRNSSTYIFSDAGRFGLATLAAIVNDLPSSFADHTRSAPSLKLLPYIWFGRSDGSLRFSCSSIVVPQRFQRPPLHLIFTALSTTDAISLDRFDVSFQPIDFDLV